MVVVVGPGLCSDDYSSHGIHCHHSSSSEVWYTLESYTACVQVQILWEGLENGHHYLLILNIDELAILVSEVQPCPTRPPPLYAS